MKLQPGRATILVVEDDPNDQVLIERAFRRAGVTDPIHVVGGGDEAIAYMMGEGRYADRAQFRYPSLVITDLKMPRVDGFAVLEHFKRNPQWAVIPTIVLTASMDTDDIRKAYLLGASSYLVKPQGNDELTALFRHLYTYWQICEVPEIDSTGRQIPTHGKGKLGERYS